MMWSNSWYFVQITIYHLVLRLLLTFSFLCVHANRAKRVYTVHIFGFYYPGSNKFRNRRNWSQFWTILLNLFLSAKLHTSSIVYSMKIYRCISCTRSRSFIHFLICFFYYGSGNAAYSFFYAKSLFDGTFCAEKFNFHRFGWNSWCFERKNHYSCASYPARIKFANDFT